MKIRAILFLLLAVSSRAQTITGADVTESGDRIRIYLTASFPPYFMGLGGYCPGLNITNDLSWLSFSNRVAAADGAITTGQGNFHINTTGPIWTNAMIPDQPRDYIIPHDMDGVARTARSTPGPFATTLSSGQLPETLPAC